MSNGEEEETILGDVNDDDHEDEEEHLNLEMKTMKNMMMMMMMMMIMMIMMKTMMKKMMMVTMMMLLLPIPCVHLEYRQNMMRVVRTTPIGPFHAADASEAQIDLARGMEQSQASDGNTWTAPIFVSSINLMQTFYIKYKPLSTKPSQSQL